MTRIEAEVPAMAVCGGFYPTSSATATRRCIAL